MKLNIRLAPLAVVAAFAAWPAAAATLDEIALAMGSAKVNNLQYTGSGTTVFVGQAMRAGGEWPRFPLTRLARTFDYANAAMTEETTMVQAEGPLRGGGVQPIIGEQKRSVGIVGDSAWNVAGPVTVNAPGQVGALQMELWASAQGIVKAALADKAAAESTATGTTFSIARAGRFKATAYANSKNLVERVETVSPNPLLGDMTTVTLFSDYKDFGGAQIPMRIIQTIQGNTSLEVVLSDAKINAGGVSAPANVQAPPPVPGATVEKIADGVYFIAGASHNSVAIEMADHVILFEAPLGDARTVDVIEQVKKTIPNKPLRFVVNTHHHFDHSGGLPAAVAEGMTVVTHAYNKAYYEDAFAAPRTIAPDRLARAGNVTAKIQTVGDKAVMSDATRTLELHTLRGLGHVDGMMIGYLPKEKILIVADAYSARGPVTTRAPERVSPFTVQLWDNLQRLKLDIDTVLPIHGRAAKIAEVKLEAGY